MTISVGWCIGGNISNINVCHYTGIYTKDPITPPKEPMQLWRAIPKARLVGEPPMLFEFQAMVMAMAENAPMAAKNVAIYRAAGDDAILRIVNPMMARRKLQAST